MKYEKSKQYYEVTITMSEAEVETLIGVIEQVQMVMNRSLENMGGMREDIYKTLKEIVAKSNPHAQI